MKTLFLALILSSQITLAFPKADKEELSLTCETMFHTSLQIFYPTQRGKAMAGRYFEKCLNLAAEHTFDQVALTVCSANEKTEPKELYMPVGGMIDIRDFTICLMALKDLSIPTQVGLNCIQSVIAEPRAQCVRNSLSK